MELVAPHRLAGETGIKGSLPRKDRQVEGRVAVYVKKQRAHPELQKAAGGTAVESKGDSNGELLEGECCRHQARKGGEALLE